MTQSYLGFRLILVALLIGLNGFFAAAEVALLSVRSSRLRQTCRGRPVRRAERRSTCLPIRRDCFP